jgi:hypothetical protein
MLNQFSANSKLQTIPHRWGRGSKTRFLLANDLRVIPDNFTSFCTSSDRYIFFLVDEIRGLKNVLMGMRAGVTTHFGHWHFYFFVALLARRGLIPPELCYINESLQPTTEEVWSS